TATCWTSSATACGNGRQRRQRCRHFLSVVFYLFLLSPLALFRLVRRFDLPPLVVPGTYLALWAAWEAYLHVARPDLWMRADLFLIVPAQVIVLVHALRLQRSKGAAP